MSEATWRPLWLGPSERRLYAALHTPPGAALDIGVLMAPALLHEQPRSRRILVDACTRLAALGVPSLRFDYFGTGDSAGRGEQHDFDAMRVDLDVAAAALRAGAGVRRIVVFAWRASAFAVLRWSVERDDVAGLALWEPVADGDRWLAALVAADRAERMLRYGQLHADADDTNLMGFPTSARWRADVATARIEPAWTNTLPTWILQRPGDDTVPAAAGATCQVVELPADAPQFGAGVGVESVAFLSRRLSAVVDALGHAFAALAA